MLCLSLTSKANSVSNCLLTVLSTGNPGLSRFEVPSLHLEQVLDISAREQLSWGQVKALDWCIPVLEDCSQHIVPVPALIRPGAGQQHTIGLLHYRLCPEISMWFIVCTYPVLDTPPVQ